eukprot:2418979-Rhodomonas_salina.3
MKKTSHRTLRQKKLPQECKTARDSTRCSASLWSEFKCVLHGAFRSPCDLPIVESVMDPPPLISTVRYIKASLLQLTRAGTSMKSTIS